MKTQMIVNRINDWFSIEDLELDIYMLSMNILLKLSTRRCAGLVYDRVNLTMTILNRKSAEAIFYLWICDHCRDGRTFMFPENRSKNQP